ncbi:P-type conjugative transfer protein TrbL [Paracoccus pantotrophus]|uniref:P-type conjugative transfer protein TrbL n=1 Tax=Paracoccus pantotrophus TaxID=82367 RepID=UPI0008E9957D|nr:P-type conjugative transfer protein TrbL [Paracoccus pantotrophus]MDF3856465.1 P-type conjugative transfer protein TrbL [Paracoccus pantotrophus]SFO86286.1 type IV secretion system protein TrbL [Paracoccus pantotrophus]
MGGSGVIDHFLAVFTSYIDSGFGLLGGEVAFIATTLIVIDVTLAALFWAWGAEDDILARLVKKTIFVGVFAWLITNWNTLARIVFDSFAGLGLMASGTGFTAADLMRPGRVAQTGLDAGRPLLESISDLMGWVAVFENLIQILCLFFAWALVILAFFILAVQLFVTLIEFKLTTLAGFVLIPFGLFGKTAFMAERVLGNVVSSGIKVLVLAVIIGIGSTLFSQFTIGFGGVAPTVDDAMAIVLAALSLLGLGIFGPGIATGLVSGGPQLGAGAVAGTGLAVGGAALAAGGATVLGAKGIAATARGGAATAGAASAAYTLNSAGQSGIGGALSGAAGVGKGAGIAALSPLRKVAASISAIRSAGMKAAFTGIGGSTTQGTLGGAGASVPSPSSSSPGSPPAWAQRLRGQSLGRGATVAAHAVRSGDSHGPGASVSLSESDKP